MPKVRAGAVALHCIRSGAGPDIVMVHGLGANLAFWQLRIAPRLALDFRVTTYDLRGHGHSDLPPDGYGARQMASDLAALLDALSIPRAHLVAHSFGAEVALRCAVMHPERVRSLTLADPVLQGPGWIEAPRQWQREPWLRRRLRALGTDVRSPLTPDGVLDALAEDKWAQAARQWPWRWGLAPFGLWQGQRRAGQQFSRLLRQTSARSEVAADGAPTVEEVRQIGLQAVVIVGGRSFYRPISFALTRHLRHARLVVVPSAGHFHPFVKPIRFARLVRAFLLGCERNGAGRRRRSAP